MVGQSPLHTWGLSVVKSAHGRHSITNGRLVESEAGHRDLAVCLGASFWIPG